MAANAAPVLQVSWPTRTRAVSAPSSALSFSATFHRTDANGTDLVAKYNRDNTLAAHIEAFKATSKLSTGGTYTLSVKFYANSDESGAVVGTASASVLITVAGTLTDTSGNPLGSLVFDATIKSVSVVADQAVRSGSTAQLLATPSDGNGNVVVTTPGSFTFTQQSGASNMTLTPDGIATGKQVGTSGVSVQIDGATSPTANVFVIPASGNVQKINLSTNDIIYDNARDIIWASTNGSDATAPNAIVPVNPESGALGTPIAVDMAPSWLTLSGDGTHMYVSGPDNTVEQLSMPSGTKLATIKLPSGYIAAHMLPVPGTADTWIVATQDAGMSPGQAFVYDGTVARPATTSLGNVMAINSTGTRAYGYQRFQTSGSQYYTATIGATGLTSGTSQTTVIQGYGNRIVWANGKIVDNNGFVVDPDSPSGSQQFTFSTIDHVAGAVPNSNIVYYAAWDAPQLQEFDITKTGAPIYDLSLGDISGGLETTTWCGPNRIVIRSFSGSPNIIAIVSGLPQ